MRQSQGIGLGLIALALGLTGCDPQVKSATQSNDKTNVPIAVPTVETVRFYEEFPGHTDAKFSNEVKSQVTGYLVKKNVPDEALVKAGDVLYEIDDRPYRAAYNSAVASMDRARAHLARVEADFQRASNLFRGANIGKEEFDLTSGDYAEARANLGIAEAALKRASLDMEYTKVKAGMNGLLSRVRVDPGNLVVSNSTILNDIVYADELYVDFDLTIDQMKRVNELISQGRVSSKDGKKYDVIVGTSVDQDNYEDALSRRRDVRAQLKRETGKEPNPEVLKKAVDRIPIPSEFPYEGEVSFTENTLDAATGTLRVRGIIKNPPPYILMPGLFVRVHLPYGESQTAILIPDEAIGEDQGKKFVYVINDDDEVVYRSVVVGPIFNRLRSIKEGLKKGERIIIDSEAIRRVHPGSKVIPLNEKNEARPATPAKTP
jgi:multidrug efflux system membrane fusion protein